MENININVKVKVKNGIDLSYYDEINPFCEGLSLVRKDLKYGFIDKKVI